MPDDSRFGFPFEFGWALLAGMARPTTNWPRISLVALTALNLLNYIDRYVLAAVATPLQRTFGIGDEKFARLTTVFMVGYFLTSPFFGYWGDRASRKFLISAGVIAWSIGTILSGWVGTFTALVACRLLVGVGEASYGTLSPAWLADAYPSGRRNQVLSIFYLAIPIGAAISFKLGGWMATSYGWRSAFYVVGGPGLLLGAAVLGLSEPPRPGQTPALAVEKLPALRAFAKLLSYKSYLLVVAGYVGYTFAMGGFVIWGAPFLERIHGLPLKRADDFFGLCIVGTGLFATIIGGYLAGRWEKRQPGGTALLLAISALAAVPAVLGAFWLPDLSHAKTSLIVAMFLMFLSTGPVNTVILGTVPPLMRASAMAASIFAIHLFGDLWSPQLVGFLSDRLGSLQRAILLTLPAAVAICAFFWTWLAVDMRRRSETMNA